MPGDKNLSLALNNTAIRTSLKKPSADIWPSYNTLRESKHKCRQSAETVKISEDRAEVNLQALVNHTTQRL